jgi:hypothetical protein
MSLAIGLETLQGDGEGLSQRSDRSIDRLKRRVLVGRPGTEPGLQCGPMGSDGSERVEKGRQACLPQRAFLRRRTRRATRELLQRAAAKPIEAWHVTTMMIPTTNTQHGDNVLCHRRPERCATVCCRGVSDRKLPKLGSVYELSLRRTISSSLQRCADNGS